MYRYESIRVGMPITEECETFAAAMQRAIDDQIDDEADFDGILNPDGTLAVERSHGAFLAAWIAMLEREEEWDE